MCRATFLSSNKLKRPRYKVGHRSRYPTLLAISRFPSLVLFDIVLLNRLISLLLHQFIPIVRKFYADHLEASARHCLHLVAARIASDDKGGHLLLHRRIFTRHSRVRSAIRDAENKHTCLALVTDAYSKKIVTHITTKEETSHLVIIQKNLINFVSNPVTLFRTTHITQHYRQTTIL